MVSAVRVLAATAPVHLTFFRAIVIGVVQGVTELFPISSLGHSVLLPALFGWNDLVKGQSASESGYLAFVVGLHVATSIALVVFFWRDWVRIISGGLRSIGRVLHRDAPYVRTSDERLCWLLAIVTIPVGVIGLALEHKLRTVFAKPTAAAVFLFINGLVLLGGERLRRRDQARARAAAGVGDGDRGAAAPPGGDVPARRLETLNYREGFIIGLFQSTALLAGLSRSGVTMVGGLVRGLNHEDAARFSFLAATPVILLAGVYKLPDLTGSLGNGIRGQVLAGSLAAAISGYISVRWLMRYFETRTLTPFAVYCLIMGGVCAIGFGTGAF
ncbi:MAG TPA: undecaprenyl-diphosphate phosphatase [Acidimicrobiales bacterium]|nr:undecaprenyl-diphosphate phosphatase [Acidimicrobiales bacterium]